MEETITKSFEHIEMIREGLIYFVCLVTFGFIYLSIDLWQMKRETKKMFAILYDRYNTDTHETVRDLILAYTLDEYGKIEQYQELVEDIMRNLNIKNK